MSIEILQKLLSAGTELERGFIVLEFTLNSLSYEVRTLVIAAAIPNWFNKEFLRFLTKETLSENQFEIAFQELKGLSFVELFPERGHNIHEKSRSLIREYLWKSDSELLKRLSKLAQDYCELQGQNQTHWYFEKIYHGLFCQDQAVEEEFIEKTFNWSNSPNTSLEKVSPLINIVFPLVEKGQVTARVASWVYYWAGQLDIRNRNFTQARIIFELAIDCRTGDSVLIARALRSLGEISLYEDKFVQARHEFLASIELAKIPDDKNTIGWCLINLSRSYLFLKEFQDAREASINAFELLNDIGEKFGQAESIKLQADIAVSLADFQDAIEKYNDAILRFNQLDQHLSVADCKLELAKVYNITQKEKEAYHTSTEAEKNLSDFGVEGFKSVRLTLRLRSRLVLWVIRTKINASAKRALDVILVSISLFTMAPFLLLISLLIKIESPGPVIFKQARVGKWGKVFYAYKFRSMYVPSETRALTPLDDDDDEIVFKIKSDPRVTRIGRFIRKSSIDELPQLINVLKGEMSLVGPRPPVPIEVLQYEFETLHRLEAVPGITGLQQVSGRSDLSFKRWVELDLQYISEQSFWKDIEILLKTIPAVLSGKGAY